MTDISYLIGRVKEAKGPDYALDIEIDIALFAPDECHKAVRANAAGTKLVFERHSGGTDTHWALDWTLNELTKASAIARLAALSQQEVAQP